MEEKRDYKLSEIPSGTFIKSINNKPLAVFLVPALIGILMLFGNWAMRIFGLLFIVFTLFVFSKFKRKTVADIYEEYIIIYKDDSDIVTLLRWDDIKTWDLKISSSAEDQLFIEMLDGSFYEIAMFGIAKISVYFRKFAFDANHREQVKARENARGSSFNLFKKKESKDESSR